MAGALGFMDSMFGDGNSTVDNSGAFGDFSDKMQQRAGAYDPWINAGAQGRDKAMGEYDKLTNNPNFLQDMIAKGFYESPYQKYMQDMTTKRMNYNASNTGMLGSGAANRALQGELTNMTGGFLNDYINRGMGSYDKGLTGYGNMANMGYQALGDQTNVLEQAYGGKLQGDLSKNAYDAAEAANYGSGLKNWIGTGVSVGMNMIAPGSTAMMGGMGGGGAGGGMGGMMGGGAGGGGGMGAMGGMGGGQGGGSFLSSMMGGGGQRPQNFNTGNMSY